MTLFYEQEVKQSSTKYWFPLAKLNVSHLPSASQLSSQVSVVLRLNGLHWLKKYFSAITTPLSYKAFLKLMVSRIFWCWMNWAAEKRRLASFPPHTAVSDCLNSSCFIVLNILKRIQDFTDVKSNLLRQRCFYTKNNMYMSEQQNKE